VTDGESTRPVPAQARRLVTELVRVLEQDPVSGYAGSLRARELHFEMGRSLGIAAQAGELHHETGRSLGPPAAGRSDLLVLVRTCMNEPFGLDALVRTLRSMGAAPDTTRRAQRLADEWEALVFFPDADWESLRSLLHGLSVTGLTRLTHRAADGRLPLEEEPRATTPWEAMVHLTALNAPPSGLPAALMFLLLLLGEPEVRAALGEEGTTALERWARRWAAQWGLEETFAGRLAELGDRAGPEAPAEVGPLIVQVAPDALEADHYHLTYWVPSALPQGAPHRGPDVEARGDELERVLGELLDEAEALMPDRHSRKGPIEFILPMELLNAPLWQRISGTRPAGPADGAEPDAAARQVVVRGLDRLQNRSIHRRWRRRWERLRHSDGRVLWNDPDRPDGALTMAARLAHDADVVCCVLSAPPDRSEGTYAELEEVLRHGVPVVLWDVEDCGRPAFRAAVQGLLSVDRLVDLPERLGRLRLSGEVGRHLVLLWDDPDRKPGMSGNPGLGPWIAG
jgi:hypothetical protein